MTTQQQVKPDSNYDVIVVGAGLSGIVAAARYLQAHQECNLTILEQDYCLGGVWSKRRNYANFWSQTAYGVQEFGDMKMERPPGDDCRHDQFKAKYMTNYLEDYVDHVRIAGRSLRDRIQFKIGVNSLNKLDGRWHLSCTMYTTNGKSHKTLTSKRLMMATGQSTVIRMPDLPGRETFKGTILHSIDFGQSDVISNLEVQHVTVLGGGKSAADMVYEAVKAGKTVSWIIRKTGDNSTGPGFFAPADLPTPGYANPGLMAQTRVMSSLQPCFLLQDTWWTWFVNRTHIGVKLVNAMFHQADLAIRNRAQYKKRQSDKGFEKLEYETSVFWANGTGGVVHHADFWELVAAKVHVHRAKVARVLDKELYLDDAYGTHFPCDAILCGTGFERDLDLFSAEQQKQLGLPYPKILEDPDTSGKWDELVRDADAQILDRFLILRSPPPHPHVEDPRTPYRLYRGIAPLHDDSIVFLNHINIANKIFGAEVQAMWTVAYFDGNINLPSVAERERDIATWIAWSKRRYLSNGELGVTLNFDAVTYADVLLAEMGVSAHRQKGMWANLFATFLPVDFTKAWKEYLDRPER